MAYVAVVPETLSTKTSDAPRYQYELDLEPGTRTKTSIIIKYKIWGRIYGNGSYDGTNEMIAWPYANGVYPSSGVTLRANGEFWYKPTWHHKDGSFTISNISMGTTSISTALEVTKKGGTNGTLSKTSGKKLTIPAWTSYTIAYNADGGSGAPGTGKKWKDEVYTVPSTIPTKTGFDFTNWKIKETGYYVAAGGPISAGSNNNYTLIAQWDPHTYSVVYNKNASDATGTTSTSTHTYGVTKALTANGFTRVGYIFKGWSKSASSTDIAYADKDKVTNLTSVKGDTFQLYAVWEEKKYTITLYGNGGTFDGKTSDTATKYYTKNSSLSQPLRTHYTFKGWSTSASSTIIFLKPGESYTINDETYNKLYAVWEENDVYLTLYGYSNSADYTQVYNNYKVYKNEPTTIILNDIPNVYQFLGWNSTKLDIVPYRDSIAYPKTITVAKNSTFYGVYKDITPTLFQVINTDVVRASEASKFPDYVNSPDTFVQIDQDGSGHKIFGYVELSGELLGNLNVTKDDVSISPTLSDTTIEITKKDNRLFFMINDVDISFTSKYIVSFNCTDNLGKPVTFNVSVPYKQPIIDIFKSDDSEPAFVDEFRFKVNNHSSAIGDLLISYPKSSKDIPSATITNVCSLDVPKGTWIINAGARFSSNATGYRSACLVNNSTDNATQVRIPAVNGQITQLRWTIVRSFSETTTVYLNQYQNSGSQLTTGSSGSNLDDTNKNMIDPCYGSFICATRIL